VPFAASELTWSSQPRLVLPPAHQLPPDEKQSAVFSKYQSLPAFYAPIRQL
jgi:hypothetical protein